MIDRSQSMLGQAMVDASAAAREFVGTKPGRDRVTRLRGRPQGGSVDELLFRDPAEADAALRTIEVDKVRGTALYDSVVARVAGAGGRPQPDADPGAADGRSGSVERRLARAGDRRRPSGQRRRIPIGIESASFRPGPLQRLAQKTGGRYAGASGTKDLTCRSTRHSRRSCARTWQLSYVTSARPAEKPHGSRLPARPQSRSFPV